LGTVNKWEYYTRGGWGGGGKRGSTIAKRGGGKNSRGGGEKNPAKDCQSWVNKGGSRRADSGKQGGGVGQKNLAGPKMGSKTKKSYHCVKGYKNVWETMWLP